MCRGPCARWTERPVSRAGVCAGPAPGPGAGRASGAEPPRSRGTGLFAEAPARPYLREDVGSMSEFLCGVSPTWVFLLQFFLKR